MHEWEILQKTHKFYYFQDFVIVHWNKFYGKDLKADVKIMSIFALIFFTYLPESQI